MDTKQVIKVINEEIDRFDYLSGDVAESVNAKKDFVTSKDFKINFVNDILNKSDNIKFLEVVGSKKNNEDRNDMLNIGNSELYYEIHLYYEYQGKEQELTLLLEGRNVKSEPTIDWEDIDATLVLDDTGVDIDLDWLKADKEMYIDFIKTLVNNDFDED